MNELVIVLTVLFSFSILGFLLSAYFFVFHKDLVGSIIGMMFLSSSVSTFSYAILVGGDKTDIAHIILRHL